MRGFILGIVILMAAPEYAVGQQRDRSGRSRTGRTAVPREEAVQASPARQTDRRAEPRGETRTPAPRDEKSDDAAASREGRERRNTPSGAEAGRGRWRDERPQAASARTSGTNSSRISRLPSSIASLNPGFLSRSIPGFSPRSILVFGRVPIASNGDQDKGEITDYLSTPAQRAERRVRAIRGAGGGRARSRDRARSCR